MYASFIDLGELNQRAHNEGDYKLGSVLGVFFWLRESVLVRPGPPFIASERGRLFTSSLCHDCGS
jgi:hypothetical protein